MDLNLTSNPRSFIGTIVVFFGSMYYIGKITLPKKEKRIIVKGKYFVQKYKVLKAL